MYMAVYYFRNFESQIKLRKSKKSWDTLWMVPISHVINSFRNPQLTHFPVKQSKSTTTQFQFTTPSTFVLQGKLRVLVLPLYAALLSPSSHATQLISSSRRYGKKNNFPSFFKRCVCFWMGKKRKYWRSFCQIGDARLRLTFQVCGAR